MVLLDELMLELLVPAEMPAHVADQVREAFHAMSRQVARDIQAELSRITSAPIVVTADG